MLMFRFTNVSDWTAMRASKDLGLHRGQTKPSRALLVKVEVKERFLLFYLGFTGQKNSKVPLQ